jgi:hypothetical protein
MAIRIIAANLGKIIAAGIIAFLVLNVLCLSYNKMPIYYISKTGATDFTGERYSYYIHMTEGFGYGNLNNEGLNNIENFTAQKIDALLMGSSHMEGNQVAQKKTTKHILNDLFEGQKYVYNLGMASHSLPYCIKNFGSAIRYYRPKEYVIIETSSVEINIKSLDNIINSTLPPNGVHFDNRTIFFIQHIPYLRLLAGHIDQFKPNNKIQQEQTPDIFDKEQYPILLNTVMQRINQTSISNNIKPIIFYHPHLSLNKDGSASANTDNEYLAAFKTACINNGIYFIDMTGAFLEEYETNHVLPHGFANTAVGAGHLNKNGHRIIANELFRRINEIEKGGSI